MGKLDGKVAIVTGGGGRECRGVALALTKEGARIAIVGSDESNWADTAKEIAKMCGKILSVSCDVRVKTQVDEAVEEVIKEYGRVDILVNCDTMVPAQGQLLEDTSVEDIELVIDTILFGAAFFCQSCFHYMRAQGGGRIINMGGMTGLVTGEGFGPYMMGKDSLIGLTRAVSNEWGKYGIRINTIYTAGYEEVIEEYRRFRPDLLPDIEFNVPAGRWGDPEKDIGRVVAFLAGPDADFICGETIIVDGGLKPSWQIAPFDAE
jgi:NAD(P)-dependent dehydrogenase (short-subunit alcohol dehydrogenase family)